MNKYHLSKLPLFIYVLIIAGCVSNRHEPENLAEVLEYTSEVRRKYSVDEQWWKQYNNPTVNRLIQTALANNPDYLKAAVNINKELYRLNLSTSDLFPTLYGDLGASTQKAVFKNGHTLNNFSGEMGVTYEIDLYKKIRDAREAQKFEYQATVMDRQTARLSLVNSVIDLYFNLEYLNNSASLTKENITYYQSIKTINQKKLGSGKIDPLPLAQAEQSLLTEQKKLLDLETQIKEQEQSLRNILNIPPSQDLGIRYSDILNQKTLSVNINVPLSVLANRPDLLASQYRLEKAFKNLKSEEKNWYPAISLKGAIDSSSNKARSTFDTPYALGGISISLPFLDWNRVKNNIKVSESDYQLSRIDFNDAINQALNEVSYYYFAYLKSGEIFNNTKDSYHNTSKIAEYYKIRYDNGKVELKDYLDAINNKNTSKKELIQQKYQIIKYENYVYKAMAGKYSGSK